MSIPNVILRVAGFWFTRGGWLVGCGILPREGGRPARHPLYYKGVDSESTPLTPSAGARFVVRFGLVAHNSSLKCF